MQFLQKTLFFYNDIVYFNLCFPFLHQLTLTSQMLNMSRPLNHLLSIKMANQLCVA